MSASISIFELYSIGIGPSSSHTVGPMRAAYMFGRSLQNNNLLPQTVRVQCDLYGSLSATGSGHGTPQAVILGLQGAQPQAIDPDTIPAKLEKINEDKSLKILGIKKIPFWGENDLHFHPEFLPNHPNGMRLSAYDSLDRVLLTKTYYSVGGGFVLEEGKTAVTHSPGPYPYTTAGDLLALCESHDLSISELVLANELTWHSEADMSSKYKETSLGGLAVNVIAC